MPREFMKYWDVLDQELGRPLLYRAQAERLNKARLGWKHYGTEPASGELDAARTTVTGLINDECKALYGVELQEVSLSAFIRPEQARTLVDSAEQRWESGAEAEAFADLADAFEQLIRDYERRKMTHHNRSVFDSTPEMTFLSGFLRRQDGRDRDFTDEVIESLKALDFTIMLVGLGVDFRRYGKFKSLTPYLSRYAGDGRVTTERARVAPRTEDDYRFCRDFILTSAIHLAEFDYDLDDEVYVRNKFIRTRSAPAEAAPQSTEAD